MPRSAEKLDPLQTLERCAALHLRASCSCRLLCCRFAAYLACALGDIKLPQPVHGDLPFVIAFLLFQALPSLRLPLPSAPVARTSLAPLLPPFASLSVLLFNSLFQTRVLSNHRSRGILLRSLAAPCAATITLAAGAATHFVLHLQWAGQLAELTPFGVSPTSRHKLSIRTLFRSSGIRGSGKYEASQIQPKVQL